MNEDRMISHYEGLRKAIAKRELRQPRMSSDLNERFMQRMELQKAHSRRRWLGAVAASVTIIMILLGGLLVLPSGKDASEIAQLNKEHKGLDAKRVIVSHISPKTKEKDTITTVAPRREREVTEVETSISNEAKYGMEKSAEVETNASDSVELTDVQQAMEHYVSQLVLAYDATCLPLDCNSSEGKVYVFQDDAQSDILGRLKSVVAWVDTERQSARFVSSPSQMTLELNGDEAKNGVNEIWFADRQYGYVYLYHTRVQGDGWASASCYMAFLDQNSRKVSN